MGVEASKRRKKKKDVRSTLLQIGLWDAPSKGRLHHWPRRTHHHSPRYNCQCGEVLKVCQRGGLRGQGRLHRSDHQVLRLRCLLIFWIIITIGCSIKYLYVFIVSDWTSLEDWVSISYLAFYTIVTLVVVSFTKECGTTEGGVVHNYDAPPAYKA